MTKTPNTSWKNYVLFISGLLVWASTFLLVQASYTVQTDIQNAVQVIKKIIVEKTNGNTGSILSGDTITTVNMQATQYCDEDGAHCTDIADVGVAVAGGASPWMTGTNKIYYTGENVGIGTDDPQAKLDVDGSVIISWSIVVTGSTMTFKGRGAGIKYRTLTNEGWARWMSYYLWESETVLWWIGMFGKPSLQSIYLTFWSNFWDSSTGIIIKPSWNVGIGTNNPTRKLHIHSSGHSYTRFTNDNSWIWPADWMVVWLTADNEWVIWMRESEALRFWTSNREQMRITSGGNVGIGTDDPHAKLDVNGLIKVKEYPQAALNKLCDETNAWSFFYYSDASVFCFCDGSREPKYMHSPNTVCGE